MTHSLLRWAIPALVLAASAVAQAPLEPGRQFGCFSGVAEKPGNSERGRAAFQNSGCAACHGIDSAIRAGIAPVRDWKSLGDPVTLASAMWNHTWEMLEKVSQQRREWPALSGGSMSDIAAYLRTLPQRPPELRPFQIGPPEDGEMLFASRGCADCHRNERSLRNRYSGHTTSDFAAAMWNHAPLMQTVRIRLTPDEMQRLINYICSIQIFERRIP